MKHRGRYLFALLGYLIIMTNLSGCSEVNAANNPATSSSINQREARAVETQFEPLFQFLAEDKKDFSKLKRYYSSYHMKEFKGDESIKYEEHVVRFDELETSNEGSYIVTKEEEVTTYPIVFDPVVGAVGRDSISFHPLVMRTVDLHILENYPVTSVMAEHPKTELTTISYEVDKDFPLLNAIIEELELEGVESASIRLSRSHNEYSYQLIFEIGDFIYGVGTLIKLK